MPHMIDMYRNSSSPIFNLCRDIMNEMQEKWKEEWEKTSNHRFRSPEDMQYAFAYYYYVIHRHKARYTYILFFPLIYWY